MCGIHGMIVLGGPRLGPAELRARLSRMGQATTHRGPDDEGAFVREGEGPEVGIGMRRLSIIDLSGGHQPISTADGSMQVVCNGEIYNFRELRTELEGRGHRFKTRSDTEVVLHAYAEWGDAFLDRIDGMFGFAIWDERRRRLLVGRDRLGIKPLYYHLDGDALIFASEAKAILAAGVRPTLAPEALHPYLSLGYVPAPLSMLGGIRKLPIASMLAVEGGATSIRRYWRPSPEVNEDLDDDAWVEAVRAALDAAVRSQMVADVPLGAFLSGGVDSSAVVGLMARHSDRPVKTYSIGFDTGAAGSYYDELPYARRVAQLFGTDHREIVVRPDVVELMPRLTWHLDEPIADSAFITTYLVSEFARRDVTVILSGVGGDELFGGYRRYLGEFYGRHYQRVPRAVRERLIGPIARRLPADRHSPLLNLSRLARTFLLTSELPLEARYRRHVGACTDEQLERLLLAGARPGADALGEAFASTTGDAVRRMSLVDLETQLPDDLLMLTDKMSMATSLECRVPLLDTRLVELAAAMPSRMKIRGRELKHVLKRALSPLLPDDILHRKKRGFGAPMGAWIKSELAPLTRMMLGRDAVARRGLFRPEVVARTLAEHEASREDHTDHLLALLNLEVWCRLYLDGRTPADVADEIRREGRR
jgi:asparagine synthase (glutamine-hydrolysing)